MLTLTLLSSPRSGAQRLSVGTNVADWLSLGTLNANASVAVARHITVNAEARVNPWTFNSNRGGIFSRDTEEGDAFGAVLGAGYTVMLHEHLNLDVGAAAWAGQTVYTAYDCPRCGRISDSGKKWFILPSEVYLSLIWVF